MAFGKRVALLFALILALALAAPTTWRALQAGEDVGEIVLPPAVSEAVLKHRPRATIAKMTVEQLDGINLYDLEFDEDEGEMEVAEDGTIIDISRVVGLEDIPPAAAEAVRNLAAGAEIVWVEEYEVRAEVRVEGGQARIVPMTTFKYVYEVELVRGKQTGEVEVGADGEILEELKWEGGSGAGGR